MSDIGLIVWPHLDYFKDGSFSHWHSDETWWTRAQWSELNLISLLVLLRSKKRVRIMIKAALADVWAKMWVTLVSINFLFCSCPKFSCTSSAWGSNAIISCLVKTSTSSQYCHRFSCCLNKQMQLSPVFRTEYSILSLLVFDVLSEIMPLHVVYEYLFPCTFNWLITLMHNK